MPAQPVVITREEMIAFLNSGKRAPSLEDENGQLVATWTVLNRGVDTGVVVKVYTSVFGAASRGVGEDSMRVAVVDPLADKGISRASLTMRTEGWQDRLREKIRGMFEFAMNIPQCTCGRRMALRKNKQSGAEFWGCTGFREGACNRTRAL
jgi:hypothetical protein